MTLTMLRHPIQSCPWLEELPARRRGWLRHLLFEKGQGWLRWGTGERWTSVSYDPPEPGEPYCVAPPIRRLAWYLRYAIFAHSERETLVNCWQNYRCEDRKRGSW